jgi:signal peptidase II
MIINSSTRRIALVALLTLALDQLTKFAIVRWLGDEEQRIIIPGFFKFVHWNNTGAAWSLFTGKNYLLAIVAVVALFVLYRSRHYFEAHTFTGQVALGLIFGGITGNLIDRFRLHHVTDFLRFYLERRGGNEIGFPAFNVADSAICIGVGLIFIASFRQERMAAANLSRPPAA